MTTGPVYATPKRHENLRGYYAAITAMDEGIGQLLDRLEGLGILDNTLVIFNGDNGMSMGHHGIWGKGNGTFPMNMYDSSVKVPFVARLKGLIPAGSVCSGLTSALDLFPTLVELLDLPRPPHPALPGRSFLPALRGERMPPDRAVVVFEEYGPVRMLRTQQHKYIHRYPYGPHELYDLAADPGEEHNLIGEPALEPLITRLRAQLQAWFIRHADPERDGLYEDVWGLGQLCSAGVHAKRAQRYAGPRKQA